MVQPTQQDHVHVLEQAEEGQPDERGRDVGHQLPALQAGLGLYVGTGHAGGVGLEGPCLRSQPVGVDGGHHLGQEEPEAVPGHAQMGDDQPEHAGRPHPAFDEEVAGQPAVAPMGLEEPAIHAQEDPDAGRHQDEDDPLAVGQGELAGDPSLEEDDHDHLHGQAGQADPVDLGHPGPDQVSLARVPEGGHPSDHTDQHGRAGHGQDEEQAQQLGDGPVGLGSDQPGHGDDQERGGPVDDQPGDGHRAGLGQTRANRVGAARGGRRPILLGQGDHRSPGHGDTDGGRHAHRLGDRLCHLVDLLEDHLEIGGGGVSWGRGCASRGGRRLPRRGGGAAPLLLLPVGRRTRHTIASCRERSGRTPAFGSCRRPSRWAGPGRPARDDQTASRVTAARTTMATSASLRNR